MFQRHFDEMLSIQAASSYKGWKVVSMELRWKERKDRGISEKEGKREREKRRKKERREDELIKEEKNERKREKETRKRWTEK